MTDPINKEDACCAAPPVEQQAAEPDFWTACAWIEGGGEAGWIPLPGYSNETAHGVKSLVLEAARKEGYKGAVTGRLMALGWEVRPVYLAPQRSTPAAQPALQAGAAEPVAWMHDEPGRVDVIHHKVKALLEDQHAKGYSSPDYVQRQLGKVEHYTIPLYAHPTEQPSQDAKALGKQVAEWCGGTYIIHRGDTGQPEQWIDTSVARLGVAVKAIIDATRDQKSEKK